MKKCLVNSIGWSKALLTAVILTAASSSSIAQNLAQHNWYFGTTVNGVKFNRATNIPQVVTDQAPLSGIGGSAVATDPSNANLLFYSDGVNVYNSCHLLMKDGTGLLGNPNANQPVVFCPIPGQTDKYFLFANSANYTTGGGISWSVVDMKLAGNEIFPIPPLGNVDIITVGKNNAIATLTGRSEGMTIVPHANGTDYWLITHKNGTSDYYATKIDAGSYPSGTFTTKIVSGLGVPTSVANFAYNHRNKKLAASAQDTKTDAIILNFDPNWDAPAGSGIPFSFDRSIPNSGVATATSQSIYDIEWDPKGQYLYLSRVGEPGINADVLQYDMINGSVAGSTGVSLTSVLGGAPVFRSWGLNLAPDSAVYHIYQAVSGGPFLMEKFTQTDHRADSVIRNPLPFGNVNFGGAQFPSFNSRANPNITVSFTTIGSCQNNPTTFFPTVSPNADSLVWNFGDGGKKVTEWSPVHTYATANTFSVTLTAYYQGQKDSVTQSVIINQMTLKLQLVQDTTACRPEFPPPRGSSTPKQFSVTVKVTQGSAGTYTWSNGQTGATLKPDSAGYYYVVVTDASAPGCSAYAGVNVKEYKHQDQRSNIWNFGNKAGIDFNIRPPKALNSSNMDAPAGCAIICDRNGQTIFYTDGDQVWDKTNTSIASGLGGDPNSAQSSIIVPVPGDETLYYIFTTQAINGTSANELRYSLFDLKKNNGKGAVVKQNILLFSKSSEHITANNNWLIAHEYGNNTFRAYRITAAGIADPVYSSIGSVESFKEPANGQGYMKLGPKNNLAVAFSTPGTSNLVELFTFIDTTGVITNYRKIDLKQPAGQVYGVEFSPGGNKVFATLKDNPTSTLYEYFLDSLGGPHFRAATPTPGFELGAIQLAPDGQIYVAENTRTTLGTFTAVEDTTQASPLINLSGFNLAGGTNSRLGLPNLIQQNGSGFGGPGFTFTGLCVGDSTKFVGTPTDAIDKFQWFFGDGGGSTDSSPKHLYAKAGTYTVKMHLTNRCGLDTTITQKVKINALPLSPTIPPAAVLCNGSVFLDANTNVPNPAPVPDPTLKYSWSTGDTTKTITVSLPTIITATNTDRKTGCSNSAQSFIVDNRPQVNIGPDITVCQNTPVAPLDAQGTGGTYNWTIDGVAASSTQFQSVNTATPKTTPYVYKVVVTDPVTTCSITAQKKITVNVSPKVTFTGIDPTDGCPGTNGKITLDIAVSAPASGPYTYSISGPSTVVNVIDQAAAFTKTFTGKTQGTYSADVVDQINGCVTSKSVGLSSGTFSLSATNTTCDPPSFTITTSAVNPQYQVTLGSTVVASGDNTSAGWPKINLPVQGQGTTMTYTIQITDAGCIKTINKTITVTPFTLTINPPDLCSTPAKLTASGASGYTWTGPAIQGSSSGASINIGAGVTNAVYTVTATVGSCTETQSITVNYDGPITPGFTQTDKCKPPVLLNATPLGHSYQWFDSGGNPVGGGSTISVPVTDTYRVDINRTGCPPATFSKLVTVVDPPITVALDPLTVCNDGNPFTLTATTNKPSPIFTWARNGTTIPGAGGSTLQQTLEGTYTVTATDSGCPASASLQIVKAPIPIGNLPAADIICNSPENTDPKTKEIKLNPGVFTSYDWFKDGQSLNYTLQIYTATSEGKYRVDLTNSYQCVGSNTILLIQECEPVVTAPNAFRPNSVISENQQFHIFHLHIKPDDFEVVIYNRWGEAVYESTDVNFKWDGGYNSRKGSPGAPLPGGTYAYVVRYVSEYHPEQGVIEKRGGVVLLR